MEDSKCFFTKLVALYSKRILYGYKCELEPLWNDIVAFRRLIRLEENIHNCRLKGSIIDEINKLRKRLSKLYSIPCPNC